MLFTVLPLVYEGLMHGHPLIASFLGQLSSLERSAREARVPLVAGQVEALRQTLLSLAAERGRQEEALAEANMHAAVLGSRVERLEQGLEDNKRRYTDSLRSFDRFRQAFEIVESLRSLDNLPDLLERLAAHFSVGLMRLALDEDDFGPLTPDGYPLLPQSLLDRLAGAIRADGARSYVGPATGTPAELFGASGSARWGSCFVYPVEDRFRPGHWVGLITVADIRTERYLPEMATDYMEHFCDVLSHAVAEVADRRRAGQLREDVERITQHDLKSPLSAILSLPQFLLESPNLDTQQRELVRMMLDAGRRMQGMITLSHSLYQMEQGTYALTPVTLDGEALMRTIWEDVGAPYRAANMALIVDASEPGFPLQGEELLCYTMLANLIKNALEASEPGDSVRVTLRRVPDWVELSVRNRRDVAEELRESFFEKYATAGKAGGSGLGTYSARLIAETHGGSIALETGQGQGTAVKVWLPDAR